MKLCKCGDIVKDRCLKCYPLPQHKQTTKERGYDQKWTDLSKRKRAEDPLCERCLEEGRTRAAVEVHHIVKIKDRPDLRLDWGNLISVCKQCHRELEG